MYIYTLYIYIYISQKLQFAAYGQYVLVHLLLLLLYSVKHVIFYNLYVSSVLLFTIYCLNTAGFMILFLSSANSFL